MQMVSLGADVGDSVTDDEILLYSSFCSPMLLFKMKFCLPKSIALKFV